MGPMDQHFKAIIEGLGEDASRPGLLKTPQRAADALLELTQGYKMNIEEILNGAVYACDNRDMVIVKDIEIYSLCEHHLLPFIGKCHIGYIPDENVIGLSKIPRLVDMFARRLQIQEGLTHEIADALEQAIQPKGVAVIVEATHLCMRMRGVAKQNSSMITSSMRGLFKSDQKTRAEFLSLIKN